MGTSLQAQKRIDWVDWAKFILIALVCVGHFSPPEIQQRLICNMHMPAFFIISGYLYHRRSAWRTFISFLVPVLFFSCVCFILYIIESYLQKGTCDITSHFYYRFVEEYFFRNTHNPYEEQRVHLYLGLWFIIALMGCRFLAGDIKLFSFTLKYKYWTLLILLVWLGVESFITDYNPLRYIKLFYAIYAYPFFLFGYILRERNFDISSINGWIIIILTTIFCVVSRFYSFGMMTYGFSPNYLLFYFNAIVGSIVLFWLCTKIKSNRWVQCFSIGTLLILPLHKHIEFFTLPIFHRLGITPGLNQHFVPWLVTVIVMLVCYYPITYLNNHYSILLGKLPKK